ncbi:MAG: NAD(P)-dependent oxidoreductase [Candidatus Levyibacteriota bacterium]|nr:MAG: NAD(P)-dependent oxidoreductase [Candidatus Levybacteria bacterium]
MKYLIIGGGGFVGSWLTRELISRGHAVVIIDSSIYYSDSDKNRIKKINNFKKEYLLKGAKIYHKKFEDGGEKILKKEKPDILIHLAGIPLEKTDDIEISLKQLTDDVALTYKIIETVKKTKLKKFIFMSSISAYGDCIDTIDEDYRLLPKTPYGVSKASCEFLIKAQLNNWNIIRTTNIYGFADMNGRACNIIVGKILKGKNFWINKNIMMDFIYVKDLVAGIIEVALKAPAKEVFHISGNNAINLIEFVNILKKHFTFEYEVKDIHDRPRRGTMSNGKAKKVLGWFPKMSIDKGIIDYVKYVKEYGIA